MEIVAKAVKKADTAKYKEKDKQHYKQNKNSYACDAQNFKTLAQMLVVSVVGIKVCQNDKGDYKSAHKAKGR